MADSYDRYENEGGSGGGFMMGLLTGTVLGAGLGMLLAPKAGSELRGAIGEQARSFGNIASEGYRRASESAGTWTDKGRDFVEKARDAVARGAEEARGYAGANTGSNYGSGPGSSSSFGGSTGSSGNSGPGTGPGDFGRS